MTFQKTVIIVATVLLICCLIFIGVSLYQSKYSAQFPPVTGTCPDYWVDVGAGKDLGSDKKGKTHCVAPGYSNDGKDISPPIHGYGNNTGNCKSKWVSSKEPLSQSDVCDYKKWANKCNVSWDGVTNNPAACNKENN